VTEPTEVQGLSPNAKPIRMMELMQEGHLSFLELIPDSGPDWHKLPVTVTIRAKCLGSLNAQIDDLVIVAHPVERSHPNPYPATPRSLTRTPQAPSDAAPAFRFAVYRVVSVAPTSGLELDDSQPLLWVTAKVDPQLVQEYSRQERDFLHTYKTMREQAERKRAATALREYLGSMGLGKELNDALGLSAPVEAKATRQKVEAMPEEGSAK